MRSILRIWRVVPTSQTGVQAPYYFVETTEGNREKAELTAHKIAEERCILLKYDNWGINLSKLNVRKDDFGRYWKYHQ